MQRSKSIILIAAFSMLAAFIACSAWADSKEITAAIDDASQSCRGVSRQIWEFKELGQQEFKSSALLKEELTKLGYRVTGDLKVPAESVKDGIAKTAFKAEMAGNSPGPFLARLIGVLRI
jgi:metal-dependent amidase/aminoacylase/carboxypeptidase family protein